jgi:hypothetical protein
MQGKTIILSLSKNVQIKEYKMITLPVLLYGREIWSLTLREEQGPRHSSSGYGFPPRQPGFEPGTGEVGFVVDEVALGQVFSEYFGFPCQSTFPPNSPSSQSSRAGTIDQQWPTCRVDPVWTQIYNFLKIKGRTRAEGI